MFETFKTVIILSILGGLTSALLLAIKPLTSKKLPARWQYSVWVAVLIIMVTPFYKLVPQKRVQNLPLLQKSQAVQQQNPQYEKFHTQNFSENSENNEPGTFPSENGLPQASAQSANIDFSALAAFIWLIGAALFLLLTVFSYAAYNTRMKKAAVEISKSAVLENAKAELKIRRKIRVRMSPGATSPLLVGLIFPVIYIPCREIPDDNMRMVFLHELSHYRRKDLLIKWLSIIVNAIHWFNPFAYMICRNISEACEVSCDISVTRNMTDEEQTLYMQTILDLAQRKEG